MKLGMELTSWVLEDWNRMIHAEDQHNTSSMVNIATSDVCCTVTSVQCPFGHTLGTSVEFFFFPLKTSVSDKQGTEGT